MTEEAAASGEELDKDSLFSSASEEGKIFLFFLTLVLLRMTHVKLSVKDECIFDDPNVSAAKKKGF